MRKIKYNSCINVDGYYAKINGKSGESIKISNNLQLYVSEETMRYVEILDKAFTKKNNFYMENKITTEQNIELYNELIRRYSTGILSKRKNNIIPKLKDGLENFISLEKDKQVKLLLDIFEFLRVGTNGLSLEQIGVKGNNIGRMMISKNISNFTTFQLINQSVTGVYEKRIDLLTV